MKLLFCILLNLISITYADTTNKNLFNQRYCEIFVLDRSLRFKIYNTIGLNNCAQSIWNLIEPSQIKQQLWSLSAAKNGPRFWTMNGIKNESLVRPELQIIQGMKFRKVAVLGRWQSIKLLFGNRKPYQEYVIPRHTAWIYAKGYPIFELISNEGKHYVMQSYSIERAPLTIDDLPNLAKRLHLPQGWRYQTSTLTDTKMIETQNNQAIVIQDDLNNTYQCIDEELNDV